MSRDNEIVVSERRDGQGHYLYDIADINVATGHEHPLITMVTLRQALEAASGYESEYGIRFVKLQENQTAAA